MQIGSYKPYSIYTIAQNAPVLPPDPPTPPEPRTIEVEGEITKIRTGISYLKDLEKATQILQHLFSLRPHSVQGFSSNHLSIWFLSPVMGMVHLELLGTNEVNKIGQYQRFRIEYLEYREKGPIKKILQFSNDQIDDETYLDLQKYYNSLHE
jgi:hypothetical protein